MKNFFHNVYERCIKKQNLLGIFVVCLALLITGVNGFFYYNIRTNNFSKNISSEEPQVVTQSINERTVTISTTTKSGFPVSITFLPCGLANEVTDKIGVCFGSGRSGVFKEDGITVWNLISEERKATFGVIDSNNENQPYRIVFDFGNHTPIQTEFEYFRKTAPTLFIENIIYEDDCWGITENCREESHTQ